MKLWMAAVVLVLVTGCVHRSASPGDEAADGGLPGPAADGGPALPAGAAGVCTGADPRVQLAGRDVPLGPLDRPATATDWGVEHSWVTTLVRLPLRNSSIDEVLVADELEVRIRVRDDFESVWVDLDELPEGVSLEVIGKPLPSMAVADPTLFSSSAGHPALGALRLGRETLYLCLVFGRQSSWFRPDTVALYVPNLSIP